MALAEIEKCLGMRRLDIFPVLKMNTCLFVTNRSVISKKKCCVLLFLKQEQELLVVHWLGVCVCVGGGGVITDVLSGTLNLSYFHVCVWKFWVCHILRIIAKIGFVSIT
jgi:hypothetical protein